MSHSQVNRLRRAGLHRRPARTKTIYQVSDRLHEGRAAQVPGDAIASTVSAWLAELGTQSPLAGDLARAVHANDWSTAHALGDYLSVDVTVAA